MEKLKFTARYRMKDIPNSDAFMKIELITKAGLVIRNII